MATVEDAARAALALPEVSETTSYGNRAWQVGKKRFAWARPFSKADLTRFGVLGPPSGPILAVSVADLGEKEAVLAANPDTCFTIPHFDGFAAVLIQLDRITSAVLAELIEDGWLAVAPTTLVQQHRA